MTVGEMTVHDKLTFYAGRVQGLANLLRQQLSASVNGAAAAALAAELDVVARQLHAELAPGQPPQSPGREQP